MNVILVTTLGTSWAIVPELIGFTNLTEYELYKNHPKLKDIMQYAEDNNINNVREIWIITTDSKETQNSVEKIEQWRKNINVPLTIRPFFAENINDLSNIEECKKMGSLIYKIIAAAKKKAKEKSSKLYLSLAGGRKTMSADMQQAAYFFGCDALLHVVSNGMIPNNDMTKPLNSNTAEKIVPIIISGEIKESYITQLNDVKNEINKNIIDITIQRHSTSLNFYDDMQNFKKEAGSLMFNYHSSILEQPKTGNFRLLYLFPPETINRLQSEKIAKHPKNKDKDIEWIRKLPKTELHCHFGGILTPEDMIDAADSVISDSCNIENENFNTFLKEVEFAVSNNNIEKLKELIPNPKQLRYMFKDIKQPFTAAYFINKFKNNINLLYEYIYSDSIKTSGNWSAKGIEYYEKLGDLQGSGLMQSESAVRTACRILSKKCEDDNIKYLELRCSPENYTQGGLSSEDVVNIIIDELKKDKNCHYSIIFTASRHGEMERVKKHIELAQIMLKTNKEFKNWFAGFDLAGAEASKSPEEFREVFLPLMEQCLNITIHAGEGESVENIWKAVYHLNADRIGHGLTLKDKPELMNRFIDRKIAVEMCPSSNYQIVGFKDYNLNNKNDNIYPLKEYLEKGIYVTINTDDPGISLTNLTQEYYKAASMTKGGLSKWDILKIIRNGFRSAFLPFNKRRELLINAEKEIAQLIIKT